MFFFLQNSQSAMLIDKIKKIVKYAALYKPVVLGSTITEQFIYI